MAQSSPFLPVPRDATLNGKESILDNSQYPRTAVYQLATWRRTIALSQASQDIKVASKTHEDGRGRRVILAFTTVSLALYAPFAWLLQLDFATKSYHFQWLCMWPILPGLVAGIPLKRHYDDPGLIAGSGIAAAIFLIVLTSVGARFRLGLPIALAVALVISIPTSFLSHWLFLH